MKLPRTTSGKKVLQAKLCPGIVEEVVNRSLTDAPLSVVLTCPDATESALE